MNNVDATYMVQTWIDSCWPIGKWSPLALDTKWTPNSWSAAINSRGVEGTICITVQMLVGYPDSIHINAYRNHAQSRMIIMCGPCKTEFERAMQVVVDWVGPSMNDMVDEYFQKKDSE